MTVTGATTDPDLPMIIFTAAFDASIARVRCVWADPRSLERWWGPPGEPATVVDHGWRAGGRVVDLMTGPDGTRHRGWRRVDVVCPPERVECSSRTDGIPDGDMPALDGIVTIAARAVGGSMTTIQARSASPEQMA